MFTILRVTAVILPMAACSTVGPDYQPPDIGLTGAFVGGAGRAIGDVSLVPWWTDLKDSRLDGLVNRGLSQNLSIKSAIEVVRIAQARVDASGLAQQTSGGLAGSISRQGQAHSPDVSVKSAALTANYVLDLFGGVRRGQQQSVAGLQAAQYSTGTARLAYLSALVGAYIDARYYQQSIELTRQGIAYQRSLFKMVQDERAAGAASDLAVAQAEAALDTTAAQLPDLESAFRVSVFAIATLLAEPAGPLLETLQKGAAQPLPRHARDIGVPANLLRNRPDVLAAEREFAAAVAAIGVAEAALYPSITLSGTISSSNSTGSWGFGPALALPVLNRTVLRAGVASAAAEARQAELAWRAAVLGAVQDVQSAQAAYLYSLKASDRLRAAVSSNSRLLELTRAAYIEGGAALTDVITASQALNQSRISLAGSVQQAAASWLSLQVASGSGWAVTGEDAVRLE